MKEAEAAAVVEEAQLGSYWSGTPVSIPFCTCWKVSWIGHEIDPGTKSTICWLTGCAPIKVGMK